MSYTYKHPQDMEPLERAKHMVKHYSWAILEKEEYKKREPFLGDKEFWNEFWDEQVVLCKKLLGEARVKLAALEQAERDSYSVSKSIDKKLGITDE